jgi:tetratricopeptide (TPR) repeat protein
MKSSLFYLLIAVILIIPVFASSNLINQTFKDAITDYHNKNYDAAVEKLLYLENNGLVNADLFYNIANCQFRLGRIGKAVLYYKKALKIDPTHQQASANLDYVQTLTKDKIEQENQGAMAEFFLRVYHSFDMNASALFTAILFFILMLLLILLQTAFRDKDKSLPVFLIFLVILFLIGSATISLLKYRSFHDDTEAVIMAATAIGYSGPGEEYTRVFTIHEGMTCKIEDENDEWLLIKLPNGIGGWIKRELLEIIAFRN